MYYVQSKAITSYRLLCTYSFPAWIWTSPISWRHSAINRWWLIRPAHTAVCIVQDSSTVLVVWTQEDTATIGVREPEPRVIAKAIATFQCKNRIQAWLGKSELDSMKNFMHASRWSVLDPYSTWSRSLENWAKQIATVQNPLSLTTVRRCVVGSNSSHLSEGIETLYVRQLALQHFAAFRTLSGAYYSAFDMISVKKGV